MKKRQLKTVFAFPLIAIAASATLLAQSYYSDKSLPIVSEQDSGALPAEAEVFFSEPLEQESSAFSPQLTVE